MTCHDAREQFSALVDEALGAEARATLDVHLAGCVECRRELEALRRTVALIHGIEPARAPAGFVDRVLAAARPEPWSRRLARRLFQPWPVKLPLEAAALLVAGVLAVWLFQRMPEQQQQVARTDAPVPVTSGRKPTPQAAPASSPPAASETKAERPAEPTGPQRNAEAPAAPPPPAQAADKRESTDALAAKPDGPKASGRPAPEGFRDRPPAPEPGRQESGERRREPDVKLRKEAPPAAEGKRAQIQSTTQATTGERDKDTGAYQGFAPPPPPSQVAGRLAASDRERAERDLQSLIAKHGGATVWRRGDSRVTLIDIEIPRDKYAPFVADLGRLGRWTAEREARELPETVRVQIQIE